LTCGLFQIHGNGAAVARQQVLARVDVEAGGWRARPVDADDLSAKVASSMAAKGTGPIAAISISMVPASGPVAVIAPRYVGASTSSIELTIRTATGSV
jgi:hypothetical protein